MGNLNRGSLGLLDILAAKSGCTYLSDLAGAGSSTLLPHYLQEIDAAAFSLREWEDAAAYLIGQSCSFETQEQAKQFLIAFAPKKGAESNERKRET